MAHRRIRLSSDILRIQLAVLFGVLLVAFSLFLWQTRTMLVHQFEERALAIANTVAVAPGLADAAGARDPQGLVRTEAASIRESTGALFVVVTDSTGIRLSHPVSERIGEHVSTDPSAALAGRTVVNLEHGTLGLSARAKVPLRQADGHITGEVSVGIDAEEITRSLWRLTPSIALYTGIAMIVGLLGSLALARRLKRQTFGLELNEIASLLQEREAMLHGVAEGVIGLAARNRIVLINDEARRLLDLDDVRLGDTVAATLPAGRVRDILTGAITGNDLVVITDAHCLVMNRMPVSSQGHDLGHIVTISDRTEQEGLLRELDSVRGLTDALRAQQHEFSNRVHALSGLLELGRVEDATEYVAELSATATDLAARLQRQIASPQLVGLLVAKSVVAGERGVTFALTDDSELAEEDGDSRALLTVIGNLVDNAIDAAVAGPPPRRVEVALNADGDDVHIRVTDTGPGVAPEAAAKIFEDGFSTKRPTGEKHSRGLGLALVHRVVLQHGGSIEVSRGPGAVFTVCLPAHENARTERVWS